MFDNRIYRNSIAVLLAGMLSIYAYWTWAAWGSYLPVWSDEFFYFINTKKFFLTSSLEAALTYTGKGSLLFHADGHGFAYPLLHGMIARAAGFHSLNIPLTNIAFILLSVVMVLLVDNLNIAQKLTVAFCFLGYFVMPLYAFTYMQETMHLFFATCSVLLLLKIYRNEDPKLIILYLAVLLLASLFRNLWLFWSIGLLPLATNRKKLIVYVAIFCISAGAAFLFSKLLWDSYPSFFSSISDLLKQGKTAEALNSLFAHFFSNLRSYFAGETGKPYPYFAAKYMIAVGAVCSGILFYRRREKIYLSAALICLVNFVLLFAVYDAKDWREIRSMSPLFYLFVLVAVSRRAKASVAVMLLFVMTSFPFVWGQTSKCISERGIQGKRYLAATDAISAYAAIASYADSSARPTVLIAYPPSDYSLDLLLLPLKTPSGKSINYAVNYFNENIGLQDFDFVLARQGEGKERDRVQEIASTVHYSLYRVMK